MSINNGAERGTRTLTLLRVLDPEPRASMLGRKVIVSFKEQRKRIVDGIQKEKSCDRFTAWNQARRKHPRLFAAA